MNLDHLLELSSNSANKCDIFGMVGELGSSAISGAFNLGSTALTNQANKEIAENTNAANVAMNDATNAANIGMNAATNAANIAMNDANNQLQQDLANQAYERSTAKNQIAELIKAGYSPQQAKQIVAGSGSAASMPMPTTTPGVATPGVMSPGHVDPYSLAAPQFDGQAFQSAFDAAARDIDRPDGGVIGQMLYNDCAFDIQNLPGFDPTNFSSLQEFKAYALETNDDGSYVRPEWADYVNTSKRFKRMERSFLGRRAFNNDFGRILTLKNDHMNYIRSTVQFSTEQYENLKTKMDVEDWERLHQYVNDYNIEKYKSDLNLFNLRPENNQEYLEQAMINLLSNEANQHFVLEALKIKNQSQYNKLKNDKDFAIFIGTMELLEEVGMTSGEINSVLAYLEASGFPVASELRDFVNNMLVTPDSPGQFVVKKAKSAGSWLRDKWNSLFAGDSSSTFDYTFDGFIPSDSDGNIPQDWLDARIRLARSNNTDSVAFEEWHKLDMDYRRKGYGNK